MYNSLNTNIAKFKTTNWSIFKVAKKKWFSDISILSQFQQFLRLCSTVADIENTPKKLKKKRTSSVQNIPEDIRKHFVTPKLQELLQKFPEKIVRKKISSIEHLYIADPLGAEIISEHILKNYNKNIPFLEVNPGVGLLTELLINKGVHDLRLFEVNSEFMQSLKVIFFFFYVIPK